MSLFVGVMLPALIAGLVQGVTGFGAGILLMMFYPAMFSVAQSSAMSQFLCAVLCIAIVWRYRKQVRLKQCLMPLIFYFPCYFVTLQVAVSMNTDHLKPVLGIFLVLLSIYFFYGSEKVKIRANVWSAFICALISAGVDAFFGIGGPTMVIYFMAILPNKQEYLGTIQCFFMTTSIYGTVMRTYNGQITVDLLPFLMSGGVALLVGAYAGSRVVNRIDTHRMKQLVYGFIGIAGLLTIITSCSIVTSWSFLL